jgi:hypothetical protein
MLSPHKYASDLLRLDHFDGNNLNVNFDIFIGKSFLEFNNIIGLPVKNGIEHPIYDYELNVIKAIEENNNIWIKKARGIGVTELVLRYLTWKIVSSTELDHKKIMLVSGTREDHANNVKERIESLFDKNFSHVQLESKYTELWLKKTWIKVMPSRNVKDLRGYTDVSYLFIDEADYFENSVNDELLHAITAYEEKSRCKTVMVSTPNAPGGLFETIERDPNSKYHKIVLTYEVGLDKIYDRQEILKKRSEPEFPREYMGLYLGKVGNVFSPNDVDAAVRLGEQYKCLPINHFCVHSLGLDVAFGSSNRTALVLTEHMEEHDKIRILYSEDIEGFPDPSDIVKKVFKIVTETQNCWVYVDGSARGLITMLKVAFNENINYEKAEDVSPHHNRILPINFVQEHKFLLQNLYNLISDHYVCIPQSMEKVIISLKSAVAKEYSLDKSQSSYNDTLDALRLSMHPYKFK